MKKKSNQIIKILAMLFIVYACKENSQKTMFLNENKSIQEKIKWLFKTENSKLLNLDQKGVNLLKSLYKENKYNAFWINDSKFSKKGQIIIKEFETPLAFGIPSKRCDVNKLKDKHLIIKEILLSKMILNLSHDLAFGFFDFDRKKLKPLQFLAQYDAIYKLKTCKNSKNEVVNSIIKNGQCDTTYQKLADELYSFVHSRNLKDFSEKISSFKSDSVNYLNFAKKSLLKKGFLSNIECDSTVFSESLKKFQIENGLKNDGILGGFTCDALNDSNENKCRRLSVVLEKLRQKNTISKRTIVVNIPEFFLRYYADDTLKSINRVIVGKFENQTPEFHSSMNSIVALPYWNVPFSITSKEMLPDAKRNSNYFARNHMKIYKNGLEFDPLTVDWKAIQENTFPYKVIQEVGSFNSLGILKLEFSNPFGVYIHDTPNKRLFNASIRTFSHGCIRCENPVDLAKLILLKDENLTLPDSLDSILFRNQNFKIRLKKSVKIIIKYQSVIIDANKNLIFLRDIYKRDEDLAKLMFD